MSYKTFSHTPIPLKNYVPPVTTEFPKHCYKGAPQNTSAEHPGGGHAGPCPSRPMAFLAGLSQDWASDAVHAQRKTLSAVASQKTKTESQTTTAILQISTGDKLSTRH